jgi:hypothetical protein
MSRNQSDQPDDSTSGGPLFEFVDKAHEVTEEERNRPRYGRPVRAPTGIPSDWPKLVEFTDTQPEK